MPLLFESMRGCRRRSTDLRLSFDAGKRIDLPRLVVFDQLLGLLLEMLEVGVGRQATGRKVCRHSTLSRVVACCPHVQVGKKGLAMYNRVGQVGYAFSADKRLPGEHAENIWKWRGKSNPAVS